LRVLFLLHVVAAPRRSAGFIKGGTMNMPHRRFGRGYSLVEVLATIAVLGLLLFAVGAAVTHVLDTETLGAGRQNVSRSADELRSRMTEEARSSTAVFVPATDVLGQPNSGQTGGHEVDFFRKTSDGSASYVAYFFDASAGTVTRYEYVPSQSGAQVINKDLLAERIGALQAVRTTPSSIGSIVGGTNVKPVNIYYGTPELIGGNGIVTVSIDAGTTQGLDHHVDVHLVARAAPTDVSIVVLSGSPAPSPGPSSSPILTAFVLTSPHIHPPHGPNHSGDPGNNDPSGGIHGPGVVGTATFFGNGAGSTMDWFELTSQYGTLLDGVYNYRTLNGSPATVEISCDGAPCPQFVPMPVATSGSAVVFHTTH
jgi:prepilin-type N-terminal cleavage/methylation domain-containing protein